MVSHDRYFISKTANKIWEIKDQEIKEFKGTYEEWVEWNERAAVREQQLKTEAKSAQSSEPAPKNVQSIPVQKAAAPNSTVTKELQKQQRIFQNLEKDLETLRQAKEKLELLLSDPSTYSNPSEFKKIESEYQSTNSKLALVNQQYESVFEKIVELESQIS